MKLLILGNHTCGNRGDSAILRGLLDAINPLSLNRSGRDEPLSGQLFLVLNRPVMGDPLQPDESSTTTPRA
jgi:colanic acid/amylovoran biosynthesis protein